MKKTNGGFPKQTVSEPNVLHAFPGDVIVLRAKSSVKVPDAKRLLKTLHVLFPKNPSVIVGDGLEIQIVRKM